MSAESNSNYELLSAYIDNMLSEEERITLEQQLENNPLLQAELNKLQQTVALINQLPKLKAPRNFTLSEAMLKQRQPSKRIIQFPQRKNIIAIMGAAASFIIVAVFMILFLTSQSGDDMSMSVGADMAQQDVAVASTSTSPPLPAIESDVQQESESTAMAYASTPTALSSPTIELMLDEPQDGEGYAEEESSDTSTTNVIPPAIGEIALTATQISQALPAIPDETSFAAGAAPQLAPPSPSPETDTMGLFSETQAQDMDDNVQAQIVIQPTFAPTALPNTGGGEEEYTQEALLQVAPLPSAVPTLVAIEPETTEQIQAGIAERTASEDSDSTVVSQLPTPIYAPTSTLTKPETAEKAQTEITEQDSASDEAATDDTTAQSETHTSTNENVLSDESPRNNYTLVVSILIIIFSALAVFTGFWFVRRK